MACDATLRYLCALAAFVVVLAAQSVPALAQGEGQCGFGLFNATSGLCQCPPDTYGDACDLQLEYSDRTRCLVEHGVGPTFCFSLLPQPCSQGGEVGVTQHLDVEVVVVGDQLFVDGSETEVEACGKEEEGSTCTTCLLLSDVAFSSSFSTFSAYARVQKQCAGHTVLDVDVGAVEESASTCGFAGTKYPAACGMAADSMDGSDGMEVDSDLCLTLEGETVFCPTVVLDACGYSSAVLLSSAGYAFEVLLAEGADGSSCMGSSVCLTTSDVSFPSSDSVKMDVTVRVGDEQLTYAGFSAAAAHCGTSAECGEEATKDDSLFWEAVGAGVVLAVCITLLAASIVVVVWRKKNGDPSGYGSMGAATTDGSLIDELADAEPEDSDED